MAEDQNNQQPNESGQDKPSRVAKARAKSKVVSQLRHAGIGPADARL